jgi:hypothetical protein
MRKKSTLYKMANNKLSISFLDVLIFATISTISLCLISKQDYILLVLESSLFLTAVLSGIYKDNGTPLGAKILSAIISMLVMLVIITMTVLLILYLI